MSFSILRSSRARSAIEPFSSRSRPRPTRASTGLPSSSSVGAGSSASSTQISGILKKPSNSVSSISSEFSDMKPPTPKRTRFNLPDLPDSPVTSPINSPSPTLTITPGNFFRSSSSITVKITPTSEEEEGGEGEGTFSIIDHYV